MRQIILRVPTELTLDFIDDLNAWTATTAIDPRPSQLNVAPETTKAGSPIRYQLSLDEGFFEQFPLWRIYVEQ